MSRQFQFAHGNFNLLTAISICSRQFQLAHGNFNLLTAITFPVAHIKSYEEFKDVFIMAFSKGQSFGKQ